MMQEQTMPIEQRATGVGWFNEDPKSNLVTLDFENIENDNITSITISKEAAKRLIKMLKIVTGN